MTLSQLLPHREIKNAGMASIRLENILTMTLGVEWNEWTSYFDPENDTILIRGSGAPSSFDASALTGSTGYATSTIFTSAVTLILYNSSGTPVKTIVGSAT